ncbi:hypothetical protein K6119_02845 [Paracrocinitomix mangrovi]|uniref:putative LPS assembly protein LptD n=1 Tax=Paracrocinitomix mangrovi TaxID=2862509 RepID=UPI001C8E0E39|nr:putative LPS assembly protein LptD [Paracrocinitomix mangrovi]UKN02458.1 hypothetical protein K6119_02845 [Paracrocinitomix mangrovi]
MFWANSTYAQSGMNGPVKYEARDSIVADIPNEKVILYGEAHVDYEGIELTADYIEIGLTNNEVLATYSLDSLGNPVGKPVFKAEGEESQCEYVKYNFETKKGYIREVRAQQDEGYIHMAEAKFHPNDQIHLKNGKFTTCENDTPHYHFRLSKAVIVPDERVVTGPVYMKIFKVPTPLAAPFAFFPNSDKKKHGLILPSGFPYQQKYGFGIDGLGYYIPLGERWETQFLGTIFTSGRFAIENTTNYYMRYKYRGGFSLRFERFKGYFYDEDINNKISVKWNHSQDAKANPSWKFSSDVNFQSDNNGKNSLKVENEDYFSNQFNSSLKVSKNWKTKKFRGSATMNTSLRQTSSTSRYQINLPDFNFSVSQFDLGVMRKQKIGKKWYEEIKVTYGLSAANSLDIPDSVFNNGNIQEINSFSRNGVKQNAVVNANLKLFGSRITLSPSATYNEVWNFQYDDHALNYADTLLDTTRVNGFGTARNLVFSARMGTQFIGLIRYKGPRETRFKHTATPSFTASYAPEIINTDIINDTANALSYNVNKYTDSKYPISDSRASGKLSWNLTNVVKMKTKNMKDTVNNSDKSFNIIDALNYSSDYDFLKDTNKMGNHLFQFRTAKMFNILSFQSDATVSPYAFDAYNNLTKDYAWEANQGFGRLTRSNITVNANFTSKTGRKKQAELNDLTANTANQNQKVTDPNSTTFDIPWQLNVAYNLNHTLITDKDSLTGPNYKVVQTVVLGGDFSINSKWKFKGGISFDLQQFNDLYQDLTYSRPYEDLVSTYNFEIWRDLHCWEAMLQFRQYGAVAKDQATGQWVTQDNFGNNIHHWQNTNWTFLFRINIKASMFQSIKLEYNQPPFIF